MADANYVIGFDVGGTRIKSGGVTLSGELLSPGVHPSGFSLAPEQILLAVQDEVRRIATAQGALPQAIGLGFPGAVDPQRGVVLLPGKLQLEGFPIVPELQAAVGVPVVAENDGRVSILAEAKYGLARDYRWAVTITLGTGVGSGVMLDGQILRDPHLQFGTQLSHLAQDARGGRLCITGARGTADTLCSATELAMMVRDGLQRGLNSVLTDAYFDDPQRIDFKAVIDGVEHKDPLCLDALHRWTENLSWFLVSVVHLFAPEIVILSGGATNAARHFLEPVQAHVNRHIFRYPPGEPVPIAVSQMGDHAGVLGAAVSAWELINKAG
jgi:glucokinase